MSSLSGASRGTLHRSRSGPEPNRIDSAAFLHSVAAMQQEQSSAGTAPAITRPRLRGKRLVGRGLLVLLLAPLLGSAVRAPGPAPAGFAAPLAVAAGSTVPARLAPPAPEPLTFANLAPEDARLINMRIPFTSSVGAIAPGFVLRGTPASRARAVDCLASAMWYEAGESDLGQRAVAQVVLNRVRHPAFPKTVCGVVFQGSERTTGCQFTFTCDGALARRPSAGGLALARARAEIMLHGGTVPQVGLATHYHTDWVHPVWSGEMDKLARVDTHLFFRWHGGWGQAPAYRQPYAADEPEIAKLAAISEAHRAGALPPALDYELVDGAVPPGAGLMQPALAGAEPQIASGPQQTMVMMPGGNGGRQSFQAMGKCSGRQVCKVFGYVDGDMKDLAFVYVRDRRSGWVEVMQWDCKVYPRDKADECLSPASRKWIDYPV